MADPIPTGTHSIMVSCPECGEVELVPLTLAGYLQVDEQAAVIRLRTHSKPVPHICDNSSDDLFTDSDEDDMRMPPAEQAPTPWAEGGDR